MRTHRFYTADTLNIGLNLPLPKAVAHHCVQVLRYQKGQQLILFNGDGADYLCQLTAIEKKSCQVEVINKTELTNESPLSLHLFQGIARGDKMDLIIQKSVELGVSQITPIFTERSNVKLDAKRLDKKMLHWNGVAISASEQSGRATVPKVNVPVSLIDAAGQCNTPDSNEIIAITLDPRATQKLSSLKKVSGVHLFIGPEGGFSDKDLDTLQSFNIEQCSLGPRVLRTETAGFTAIAVLQSHFGDL